MKMSKIHTTRRSARRAERARRKIVTRSILGGIILLILAAVIWLIVVSIKPSTGGVQTVASPSTPSIFPTEGGPTPGLVGTKQYTSAPPIVIDITKQYFANVTLAKGGEFVIQLFPDKAPLTVNSFVFLARNKYFDGVTFHRVISGFMAQGGDPTGTGGGGPGYSFVNESNDLKFDKAGVVAMANSGRDTNGSQFFITFGPYGGSESDYTIFGQIISGMDVVNGITPRDPSNPKNPGDVIQSITISEK
jgi:peptidylprolyl isomerase